MEQVKINSLEIENVKRVKAVAFEPTKDGLTIIGGKNGQGKTSVLDAIAWTLAGDRYKPSEPKNRDSVLPPHLKITLNNGLVVERKGENSNLTVVDPSGQKAGQTLLNSFVNEISINLPRFLEMNSKDKARTLLRVIGLENEIAQLDREEERLAQERLFKGRERDQKKGYADTLQEFPDTPKDLVSIKELIDEQQRILAQNGENQRLRDNLGQLKASREQLMFKGVELAEKLKEFERLIMENGLELSKLDKQIETAEKTVEELKDESTAELEQSIADIERINEQVRSNLRKEEAYLEAEDLSKAYGDLTSEIEDVREQRLRLLNDAKLPLAGLSVTDGELTYNGDKWDAMSSSDQLKVGTAIARAINPSCGFVLLDKLEQLDLDTLTAFSDWLKEEGLQVIGTRVSGGDECQIIIEDGEIIKQSAETKKQEENYANISWG